MYKLLYNISFAELKRKWLLLLNILNHLKNIHLNIL